MGAWMEVYYNGLSSCFLRKSPDLHRGPKCYEIMRLIRQFWHEIEPTAFQISARISWKLIPQIALNSNEKPLFMRLIVSFVHDKFQVHCANEDLCVKTKIDMFHRRGFYDWCI